MGGKVYDRRPLVPDRDPLNQLAIEVGKFPKIDPIKTLQQVTELVTDYLLDALKNVTGIDFASWTKFLAAFPGLDASKIISGIFSGSLIPGLDASKIVSGILSGSIIPGLDASKIVSGIFGGGLIPGLDASKIVSGTFPMERVAGLLEALATGDVAGIVQALTGIVGGGLGDLEHWAGLVPLLSGGLLSGSWIPGLDASKIVSGQFPQAMLSITSIAAGIVSGVFGAGQIPGLDASKITSGNFAQSMITGLPAALASMLTSASPLDATKLFGSVASSLLSGTLAAALIPSLDASKIGSGQFPQSMLSITSIAAGIISGTLAAAQIPSLDASKIGSGQFGVGQIPNLPATILTTGTLAVGLIPSLAASIIGSGTLDAARVPGLDASKIISGTLSGAVTGVQAVVDNFVQGAGGSGTGNPATAMFDWAANLLGIGNDAADAAAAAAAATAALQAQVSGNTNNGTTIVVNFSDYANGAVPAVFTKTTDNGAGGYVISNGRMVWQDSGGNVADELYIYNAAQLVTDFFDVAAVMPAKTESSFFGGTGYTYLIARANAAGTALLIARFSGDGTARIGYMNGGVINWAGAEGSGSIPANATIRFRSTGPRQFQAISNGAVIASWNDTGNASTMGAANRLIGLGGTAADRNFGSSQTTPGSFSIFTGADNAPNPVVGTGARVYRNTATGVTKASGTAVLPANCLNTVDYTSSDITWDGATQRFTVQKSGLYMVGCRLEATQVIGMGAERCWVAYKNGVLTAAGNGHIGLLPTSTANDNENRVRYVGGDAPVLSLGSGDTVQIGAINSESISIIGDAGGTKMWASITKVG